MTPVLTFQRIKIDDILVGDAMAGLHVKPNKQSVPQSDATDLVSQRLSLTHRRECAMIAIIGLYLLSADGSRILKIRVGT